MALLLTTLTLLIAGASAFLPHLPFNKLPFQHFGPGIKQPFFPQVHNPIPYGYKQEKPLQLTCLEVFQDYEGYIDKGLSANIKPASHFGQFGGNNFLHGFHGALAKPGSSNLEAEFKFFSTKGGKISLIITKKGFVGQKCDAKNFGNGLTSSKGSFGLNPFDPYSAFQGNGGYKQFLPKGVIAEFDLKDHTAKHLKLDNLKPYNDIKRLAGRGLIACNHVDVDYDGTAICIGEVLACCTLAYDHKDRKLQLEYN